jgi:citrate synthase
MLIMSISAGMSGSQTMDTAEVARRLGVKPETVYAYVSRGLLERDPRSRPHRSLFARDVVERLAARARRTNRSGALEVVVETELTLLDPAGRLLYRGRDGVELARHRSFEEVAALLWDGETGAPWELEPGAARAVSSYARAFGEDVPATERIPVIVATLGATDPLRADRRPDPVRRVGAVIFAGILDGLPRRGDPVDRGAAARLWTTLVAGERRPTAAQLAALNAALVLLADHELAASTLAARVAASAWADPYRVVLAGLGPIGGSLHGGGATAVESILATIDAPADVLRVLDQHLGLGMPLPGFGHRVYRDRDPRADHLLERLPRCAEDRSEAEKVEALLEAASSRGLPAPNVDLALAALARSMGLRPGSASTIFTFARIAGMLAHALEEYPHRLRFRPRATYIGPE